MAENVTELFNSLGLQMAGLKEAIQTSGMGQDVKPFSGVPREYKDWIKSIEKHARLRGLTEDKIKLTAYQTARDAVSDFIDRLLTADPNIAWDRMKDQLAARFAEVSDKQQAFSLLQKLKQKPTI